MIIDIITIFPKMFSPVLGESIIKRAQQKGLVKLRIHDLRDYTSNRHRKVDAPGFGPGPGMVMRPEPFFNAVESILKSSPQQRERKDDKKSIVFFTPQGKILNQTTAKKFLQYERLMLLVGRYEGIDERIRQHLVDEEISLGDYVLSGGELAAMVFIDVLVRLIPGVVSAKESIENESFEDGLLDYPQYTKPRVFKGMAVPEILLSGDHAKIKRWRKRKALENTRRRRPDLLRGKKEQ